MARIPNEPVVEQGTEPAATIPAPEPVTLSTTEETELRTAAESLGLNYDRISSDEREFLDTFVHGGLSSLTPEADPDNPLIPGDSTATPTQPDPAEPTGVATAEPGAEDRVGPSDSPEDGELAPTVGTEPAVPSPEAIATPGLPEFVIPSTLPPPAPTQTETPPPVEPVGEPLVMLPDGQMVTIAQAQAYVAAQQASMQQPPAPVAPPVVPNAWADGAYVDERAGAELGQMQQTLAQIQAQQQQLAAQSAATAEYNRNIQRQAIDQAIVETTMGYAQAKGITVEQAQTMLDQAAELGIVGAYSNLYPGDPRRAVAASIENVYNNTPEMRALEIQREVERQREANADVDRKRALAGQTVSAPGSVPRAPAPARTRAERDAGMVAMIEADMRGPS